jgi:hypothetical protein
LPKLDIASQLQDYLSHLVTNCLQIRMVPAAFLLHPAGPYKQLCDLWDE